MNPFQMLTAIRIAEVSAILASIVSPASWFVVRERAEETIVSLDVQNQRRLSTGIATADDIGEAISLRWTMTYAKLATIGPIGAR